MYHKLFPVLLAVLFFTACEPAEDHDHDAADADNTEMSKEERNKQTAMDMQNHLIAGNFDAMRDGMADDFTEYFDGSMDPVSNKDSAIMFVQEWKNAFPDMKIENQIYAADGDYVLAYGVWSGTFENDMMGMKATGKSFTMHDVDVFKFNEEGKIVEHRGVQNGATMMMQLGAEMPKE